MWNKTCINSIGLSFDIIGAILIFKYGIPENINRKGESSIILENVDVKEINKAKNYDFIAKIGILSLILGFSLQLLSNFLPE